MTLQARDLRRMSRGEHDELFLASSAGRIPKGRAEGTALLLPGSRLQSLLAGLVRAFCWKGKIFRPETRDLKNRLGPLGFPAIRAEVYVDTSWFADGPAIILDYSRTSLVAGLIRDEIREVAPGLYLGIVYVGRWRIAGFMLEFPQEEGEPVAG